MSEGTKRFATDTATLCVCDPVALAHRLNDEGDWWTDPDAELLEVNAATVLFFGLGADGVYELAVSVTRSEPKPDTPRLSVPSGRVFIGAGEEVPGEGLLPDGTHGGVFLDLEPGAYAVSVLRRGCVLNVEVTPCPGPAVNAFSEPLSAVD